MDIMDLMDMFPDPSETLTSTSNKEPPYFCKVVLLYLPTYSKFSPNTYDP